jgi:hypothetical protein
MLRLAGHIPCCGGGMRNAYNNLVGRPEEERGHLIDIGIMGMEC